MTRVVPGTLGGVQLSRVRASGRRLVVRGLTPGLAAVLGCVGAVLVGVSLALLDADLGHAAQALLLVVPVVATAVLGGRRPAQCTAACATVVFLLILPPAGSLRLHFADDVVALIVFMLVALTVGGMVAVRLEMLGHLERQRSALLRSVSHDLRTPLTTVCAAVSELQDGSLYSSGERQRLMSLVSTEANRLDRLVGNLLSLARIEGGGLEPRRRAVDPGELAESCAHRLRRSIDATDIVIRVDAALPLLHADHTLLDQVLTNFLENAVRHSPPGEPVELAVGSAGGHVRFVVSDGGPGVAPEDVAGIFEPFRSGPTAGTSGIGLAICEAIVKAHRGAIDVSTSSRGGAAFTVTLPVS